MKRIYLLMILACIVISAQAQTFTIRTVKNNLFIPWEIIYGPDDHIWFTQKNGFICRTEPVTGATDTLYHATTSVVQGEGGMLGMAMHPAFPATPYLYVAYEYMQGGDYTEKVVRLTYFPTGDSLGAEMTVLDNIEGANIHNGCRLHIVNDKLFISTGDAANQSLPQNINSINGKILRINLDGTIPGDNPIAGSPVWSWGDRNTQGMVYANNKLYTSMHGASSDDEINIIEPGRNYGWPTVQGFCNGGEVTFCNDSNVVEPIIAWTPTIAASGMDYYDHPMFPAWQGSLMMGTLKDNDLYFLKLDANFDSIINVIIIDTLSIGRIRDVCISPNGSIFLSTSNSQAGGGGSKIDRIVELYDSTFIPVKVPVQSASNSFSIYPNPTKDEITVSLKHTPVVGMDYRITNSIGQVLLSGKMTNRPISLKSLPVGLYTFQITSTKGERYTRQILKE